MQPAPGQGYAPPPGQGAGPLMPTFGSVRPRQLPTIESLGAAHRELALYWRWQLILLGSVGGFAVVGTVVSGLGWLDIGLPTLIIGGLLSAAIGIGLLVWLALVMVKLHKTSLWLDGAAKDQMQLGLIIHLIAFFVSNGVFQPIGLWFYTDAALGPERRGRTIAVVAAVGVGNLIIAGIASVAFWLQIGARLADTVALWVGFSAISLIAGIVGIVTSLLFIGLLKDCAEALDAAGEGATSPVRMPWDPEPPMAPMKPTPVQAFQPPQ